VFSEIDSDYLPWSRKIRSEPPDEILSLFLWRRECASFNDPLAQVRTEQKGIGRGAPRKAAKRPTEITVITGLIAARCAV
jgi:hypothetical protein